MKYPECSGRMTAKLLACIGIVCILLSFSTHAQGNLDFIKIEGTQVDIYTPPHYDQKQNYPVVYFNDGQMLFGHPSMTIALHKILDSLISNKHIRPLIVVGIAADHLRTEKYVPYQDDSFQLTADDTSYAEFYSNYLLNKVIPYVDANYSTIKDVSGRAIFGFSFGGLNALWMLFNYPSTFSMSAGLSASMWVSDFAMFNEAKKYQSGQKIWFDVGTGEWNYYVPFQKQLKENGAKINEEVFYYEVVDGVHNWQDVKNRIHMPLMLFAGTRPDEPSRMDVEIEIIPSQSVPGKKFTRLNPIVTCKNGLMYSLAYEANYEVINPEAGKVYEEGRFELSGGDNLEILVTYKEFSKKVKIRAKLVN